MKNIPSNMSPHEVSKIFATYGKVHRFVQDPARKQVVYVLMNSENAQKAINSLHGKAIAKNCHPLVVEQSKEVSWSWSCDVLYVTITKLCMLW